MVGVIIARAVREDDVRLKIADGAHERFARFERRGQAAVVERQNFIGGAEVGSAFLRFCRARFDELFAAHGLVACVAGRHGDKADNAAL